MSYKINGNTVGDDTAGDWRHRRINARTPRSEAGFPGDGNRYFQVGEQKPAGVVVEGYLMDDNFNALTGEVEAEEDREATRQTYTVFINGVTYSYQHLVKFETIGGYEPVYYDGEDKYRVRCRWTWVGVRA